jgi:hypothetical protein
MTLILRDRTRRNAVIDLGDIAARLGNIDVNLRDTDRIRDARTINWIVDAIKNKRSGDLETEQFDFPEAEH